MREYFLDSVQEPSLVHNKSDFKPPAGREEELDEIIKEVSKLNIKKQTPKNNLSKAERNALQQLKTNRDIVIKEADKDGAIVIMTKEQYGNMVMKHLNSDTYEAVTEKIIDKKVMKKIEDFTSTYSHLLKEKEAEYFTNFKFSTSNFYVLPKVHKNHEITKLMESNPVDYLKIKDPPEIPSRPIIAGPSSPTHRLSKVLDIILRPLTEKAKSYVRDDIEFLSHLPKTIDFESAFVTLVTSLYMKVLSSHLLHHTCYITDVTSLYTNISHERGIEAISYWIEAYPN